MNAELEDEVRRLFADLDRLDFEALSTRMADDAQGVDELSRRWMRGRAQLTSYFEKMGPLFSDITSEVSDVEAVAWGDVGLVTCWLEQRYTLDGQPGQVSAPTTVVFRRAGDAWQAVLVHSVALPEQA